MVGMFGPSLLLFAIAPIPLPIKVMLATAIFGV
jgi:hypothetical protein